MVFGHKNEDKLSSTTHHAPTNVAQQTVTTTTTAVPTKPIVTEQAPGAIVKDAVVTNVMEKPIVQNVIEKKNVEIHHKPVVQEVHEQKIIEIEKQNVVQNVQKEAQFSQARAETRYEEIGSAQLGEQERLRLASLHQQQAPKVIQQGSTQQVQEGEVIGQVVKQEFIEKHVQPVITEVRNQKVVEEVVHPIVRKVHEAPIVREVTGTTQTLQSSSINREFAQQQGTWRQGELQPGLTSGATAVHTETQSNFGGATTTTNTIGRNTLETEQMNLNRHENKLINQGGMDRVERDNLAQHEQVVQKLAHTNLGTAPTTTGTTGVTQTTTTTGANAHRSGFNDPYDDESQQKGFFGKLKDKLHLGHHDTTK